ncbi:hypothetical protein PK28_17160 (plasmid) [Hymenobacter sp. DG25B]|nr:hypothetical protein PK28_17160 [Hymenobacter sp. DG25B]
MLLVGFVSCTSPDAKQKLGIPIVGAETQVVLESLIQHDSLALSSSGSSGRPILSQLAPLGLIVQAPVDTGFLHTTIRLDSVTLRSLLRLKYLDGFFFTSQDSLALIQQAQQQQMARFDTTRLAPSDWLSPQALERQKKQQEERPYYRFSQPLFSSDSSRAYLLFDYHCIGCGGGVAYLVERKDGVWQPVGWRRRWIN